MILVACLRATALLALAMVAYLAGRRHERASMLTRLVRRRDAVALCTMLLAVAITGCRRSDTSSDAPPAPPGPSDRPHSGRLVGVVLDTETGEIYARIVIR